MCLFFFFKQKTAYEMRISDWSSDVCSSDLQIVREDATLGQELAILVQAFQRHVEAMADARDLLVLFRRQMVEILVRGFARVDLVLDAVETGHHHRREREVRIGQRVREAHFDAAPLRIRSEEHTSELQSLMRISYAVFCLKKKKNQN